MHAHTHKHIRSDACRRTQEHETSAFEHTAATALQDDVDDDGDDNEYLEAPFVAPPDLVSEAALGRRASAVLVF